MGLGRVFVSPALLPLLVSLLSGRCKGSHLLHGRYSEGDEAFFECRNMRTGAWEPGPVCHETNNRFSVFVGIESFRYCAVEIANQADFDNLKALINQSTTWQCRVPSTKLPASTDQSQSSVGKVSNHPSYIPFSISYIGHIEDDHVRINSRMNLLFHIIQGEIVAAAAYPVLDRLQYVKVGNLVSMHGSVVWIRHLSLRSSALSHDRTGPAYERQMALGSAFAATLMTLLTSAVVYVFVLKPAIIRRCMKKD